MEIRISADILVRSCASCSLWVLLLVMTGKIATSNVNSQAATEELSHYGTEFILGMTDYGRVLHIASEQQGTFNLSVPEPNIIERGSLVKGCTTVHVDIDIYPGIRKGNGLYITTSVPVSIVVSDKGLLSRYGAFLALPTSLMGTSYIVPAFKRRFFGVVVVAVYKNTSVALIQAFNKTERVRLSSKLDTFTAIGYEEDTSSTVVLSDIPVSVIAATSRDEGNSQASVLVEQMLPYDAWTNEYIIPPLPPNTKYNVRILSMENQTACFTTKHNTTCFEVKSVSTMNNIQATETMVVTSNAPISIIQHGAHICNTFEYGPETFPFMILIPGIKHFLSKYSFVIPDLSSRSDNFVVAIISSSKVSDLLIDGSVFSFDYSYSVITRLGAYNVLIKRISIGYHVMHHVDPRVRFGAIAYGTEGSQCTSSKTRSYGFALGYAFKRTLLESTITQTRKPEGDNGLNNWSVWSTCSASCDVGSQIRVRMCSNDTVYRENDCRIHLKEIKQCISKTCTDEFNAWSTWSVCSRSCGGGVHSRKGLCSTENNRNRKCHMSGTLTEIQQCNTNPCPVDGGFSDWSVWSDCSVTCGTGFQDRSRPCDSPSPTNGGQQCAGAREEVKTCYRSECKGHLFGYTCTMEEDNCGGKNTRCLNNKCVCADGYRFDGMECVSNDGDNSDTTKDSIIIILSVVFGLVFVAAVSVFVIYKTLKNRRICIRKNDNCDTYEQFDRSRSNDDVNETPETQVESRNERDSSFLSVASDSSSSSS